MTSTTVRRPRRSVARYAPTPLMRGHWIISLLILAAILAVPLFLGPLDASVLATGAAYSLAAVGVGIGLSSVGMWALMQPAMMLLGAFVSAYLIDQRGWPFLLVLVLVPALVGIAALPLGWLTSRLDFFSFAVLGFVFTSLLAELASGNLLTAYTGGELGVPVDPPSFGGWEPTSTQLYLGVVVLVLAGTGAAALIMRSGFGRRLMLMREDDVVAGSVGENAASAKIGLTVLVSVFGGLGGVLVAQASSYAAPAQFDTTLSTGLLAVVLVGGQYFSIGPLIGAMVLITIPDLLNVSQASQTLIAGIVLVVALIAAPDGVAGLAERGARAMQRRVR
jgi:branched-chain amino acid transport system permease protein